MAKPSRVTSNGKVNRIIKTNINLINKEDSHSEYVRFSFKYLISDNASYSCAAKDASYFIKLIERLTTVCRMTCAELRYPATKPLRNHFIDWEDTTQTSFGLPNEDQLVDRAFQFGISANEHGRLIGFFIDKTFYIVWFDTEHNTYS